MENFQDKGVWIRIRIRSVLRGWIRIRTGQYQTGSATLCQTVKRTFVTNSKTDKKCSEKKLYLLKGLIVVKPKMGVILPKVQVV